MYDFNHDLGGAKGVALQVILYMVSHTILKFGTIARTYQSGSA